VTDVLLIAAPLGVRSAHAQLSPPLGLASIGANCEASRLSVTAIDFNLSGLNLVRLRGVLNFDRPRIIGISANTETWTSAQEIAAAVKAALPASAVVMGGAHPSILPEECLRTSVADYVIVGPGEKSFVALTQAVLAHLEAHGQPPLAELAEIPGLYFRGTDGQIAGSPAAPLGDPDELPWADHGLFPLQRYKDRCTVLTATGSCPYRCSFCSASALWQGRRRARSVPRIIDELRALGRHGIHDVFFADDIFTLNKRWTLKFCAALTQAQLPLTWGCATRIDRVDDELLEAMAGCGCDGIQFGVESGAAEILQHEKGIDKDAVRQAVRKACALDIKVLCSFMVPFPEDTLETLQDTKCFIKELAGLGANIAVSYTCPYPGTPLAEHADDLGIRILPQSWADYSTRAPMIETRQLSAEQIQTFMEDMAQELGLKRTAPQ